MGVITSYSIHYTKLYDFAELRQLARGHELTRNIDLFLLHPSFPVDIRHNAKIFREKLAEWANKRVQLPSG